MRLRLTKRARHRAIARDILRASESHRIVRSRLETVLGLRRALERIRDGKRMLPSVFTRQSAKTLKGEKYGIMTLVHYGAPHKESGFSECPFARACAGLCLGTESGRMRFDTAKVARIVRSWAFRFSARLWEGEVLRELRNGERLAAKRGMRLFVRFDGTTDNGYGVALARAFPGATFYDYTKDLNRMRNFLAGGFPSNYHTTFSRSEHSHDVALAVLSWGGNVAVPVRGTRPDRIDGFETLDGDKTDGRPGDGTDEHGQGRWVVLSAKGTKAKRDRSGFVLG